MARKDARASRKKSATRPSAAAQSRIADVRQAVKGLRAFELFARRWLDVQGSDCSRTKKSWTRLEWAVRIDESFMKVHPIFS